MVSRSENESSTFMVEGNGIDVMIIWYDYQWIS
jgi:hypothetical protein